LCFYFGVFNYYSAVRTGITTIDFVEMWTVNTGKPTDNWSVLETVPESVISVASSNESISVFYVHV
jgi:hypothetical protein